MIGSRSRQKGDYGACDEGSDWDFQLVTGELERFRDRKWMSEAEIGTPSSYVLRRGRLGSVSKVSIVCEDGEMDLVLIPSNAFRLLRLVARCGLATFIPRAADAIRDLGVVWQGGVIVFKGSPQVERLIKLAVGSAGAARLDDEAVCAIANGFVCDYVSAKRKLQRGEILAAQRWLHVHLAEAKFQLLHELRLRRGMVSFQDARRLEVILGYDELRLVKVEAHANKVEIGRALDRSADACAELVLALVGPKWSWPQLPSSLSREEFRDDVL